jgi:hypothetical protein
LDGGSPSASREARRAASTGEWKLSRSRRTRTSESSFNSCADLVAEQDQQDASGGHTQHGEDGRGGAQLSAFEQRRSLAPRGQRCGIDTGSGFFGDHGQFFAEIDPRAQLIHGAVARADTFRSGGCQEPARQRILADVGARGAQQFE